MFGRAAKVDVGTGTCGRICTERLSFTMLLCIKTAYFHVQLCCYASQSFTSWPAMLLCNVHCQTILFNIYFLYRSNYHEKKSSTLNCYNFVFLHNKVEWFSSFFSIYKNGPMLPIRYLLYIFMSPIPKNRRILTRGRTAHARQRFSLLNKITGNIFFWNFAITFHLLKRIID